MVGGVRWRQLSWIKHEHSCHVDRDVPVSYHDRTATVEVELVLSEIRMAVVPGDEFGRRMRAGTILTRYPEPVIQRRSDCVYDGVVPAEQVLPTHVAPKRDTPEEAKRIVTGGLLVHAS